MSQINYLSVWRILITLAVLLAACAMLKVAAQPASLDGSRSDERPDAGGPPDEIAVRFALLDIDSIDDREQRFSVDAYFEISWQDRRLAVDPVAGVVSGVRTFPLDNIWTPGLTIVNDRGITLMLPQVAEVDNDGNVVMRQRLSGRLAVDLDLHAFPADTQRLAIEIVAYRYPPSELIYSADTVLVATPSSFSADGWQFEILQPEYSLLKLRPDGEGRSQLTLAVTAKRDAGFYVLTLAVPMMLILFMAWAVHWLPPGIIPVRMSMSTATVFSLIALGVSLRLSLPRIGYLTQADRLVMYATLLVLLSLGITVMATRWVSEGREGEATRITMYTRWAFPLVIALTIWVTLRA